jgi:predicted enzyme related to lactoylglutathione lyase
MFEDSGAATYSCSVNEKNNMKNDIFIWHELDTTDQKRSGNFINKLFGWTIKEIDAGEFGIYTIFQKDGQDIAGMMNPTKESPNRQPQWQTYISVDNVDEYAERTIELGGKVLVQPHEVQGFGRVCLISDPTGASMPLVTTIKKT